jgi:tRNA-binding protein
MNKLISWDDFTKVDMRCGEIIEATLNPKANKPAYVLKIDFGEELGIKTSSAQITQNYQAEDLVGKKVIAVVNFEAKKVAGIKSEVLVLATVCETLGTLLLSADAHAINGSRVL